MNEIATENELISKISNMKVELFETIEITPDPMNTKTHPDDQIEEIARSMKKRWTNPILVDESKMIIAGHGRLLAAKLAGFTKVPCIMIKGLTEAEKIELQIFDNKSAEKSEWDFEKLQAQIDRLLSLGGDVEMTGWSLDELEESLLELEGDEPKETDYDKLDEAPEERKLLKTRLGDIFILGNHRLMCGDSTNENDVAKLMDGHLADMVFTDPPYGVSYKGNPSDRGKSWKMIKNDELRGDGLFLFLFEVFKNIKTYLKYGRAFYIWYATGNHIYFETALKEVGLKSKQVLNWKKSMVLGHSDYHWANEPVFYGCHEDKNCEWFGDRTGKTIIELENEDIQNMSKEALLDMVLKLKSNTTIWDIKKDNTNDYVHPTQKPVLLSEKAMINSSKKGEIILDLFGGSGSTLIGAENRNRKCYTMELEPRYCDVIIRRFEKTFNKQARRIDGALFNDIKEYEEA